VSISLIVSSLGGLNMKDPEPRTETRDSRAGEDVTQLWVLAHHIGGHDLLILCDARFRIRKCPGGGVTSISLSL